MHLALDTFSTFGAGILCLVLAVMALSIFYGLLNWIKSSGAKPETLALRGVLKKDTLATVYMQGGETFEKVRFLGFTNTHTTSAGSSWHDSRQKHCRLLCLNEG